MIFEAYRALRDQNELLTGKLQNEVSCRVAAELETDRAEQGWRVDKERYKKEIKRLELIIAKGRMGLAEVTRARQDSMLKRTHEGIQADHVEDRKETVFEFLERTRAEDEDAMQTHRAVFHSRPVSPSQRMAALSHEISATTFQKYIPRNLRSDTEVTTLSRASIYDELFSADPKIDRTSSQKPNDDLYNNFKANFSALSSRGANDVSATSGAEQQASTSLTNALDVAVNSRQYADHQNIKDADPTPRGSNEPWNFVSTGLTPSALDTNSHAYNAFANHLPGYYTPTPGGTNTIYHSQAGDLHTPGFMLGPGTPLSMPTSDGALHLGQQPPMMHGFHPQIHLGGSQFANTNPFHMHQTTFPPQSFQHQPPMFEHMETQGSDSPMNDMSLDIEMQNHPAETFFQPQRMDSGTMMPPLQHPSTEKFRYHTTLNAPTAMIKQADEIPVTYLNKGQAYTLNVVDTAPQQSVVGQLKYRTFVRVSFEDESQRQKPGACWQLWKEGRGTNEAHQRGGRLQAVEYVDQTQMNGGTEDASRPQVELESASFDGFCVTWTPGSNGNTECPISVRFNFLSTDFSHSKGVKGIPVRLCTKTELLLDSMSPSSGPAHEVCYCKVKLFRDHGAERKLANDVSHVKKMIEKLNQQIAQMESGMRDLGKRKRSGSISKSGSGRPGKMPKHKRTWSMSSTASGGGRNSAEDDLHLKLIALQDMFGSTRPASILFLRGAESDDPDLHPVRLAGEPQDLTKIEPADTSMWERQSVHTQASSSMVSPTPSNQSLASTQERKPSNLRRPSGFGPQSRMSSIDWANQPQVAPMDLQASNPQHLASPPDQPVKVQTRSPTSGTMSGWIETLGMDHSYQPPADRVIKPIACFYIQPRVSGKMPEDGLYRAIYLTQRTVKDFVNATAMKCGIEPTNVIRILRVNRKGLNVLIDDEAIREMPEGQDMTAEFAEVQSQTPQKPSREWDSGSTDIQVDGDLSTTTNIPTSGYELKLLY
ncbi:hypothetical protein MBLNU459_g7131t1 [Dothideomycetes sp. NU459]